MKYFVFLMLFCCYCSCECSTTSKKKELSPMDRVVLNQRRVAERIFSILTLDPVARSRAAKGYSKLFCGIYSPMSLSSLARISLISERWMASSPLPQDGFKASAKEKLLTTAHFGILDRLPPYANLKKSVKKMFVMVMLGFLHGLEDEELREYNNLIVQMYQKVQEIQNPGLSGAFAKLRTTNSIRLNLQDSVFCNEKKKK